MKQFITPHTTAIEKFGKLSRSNKRKALWKDRTHGYIDLIWNSREYCTRRDMYKYLRKHIGKNPHVSCMSVGTMKITILWAVEILNNGRELDKKYINKDWDLIPIPNFVN